MWVSGEWPDMPSGRTEGAEKAPGVAPFADRRMRLFREKLRDWAMGMALFALIFQALIPAAQAIPVSRSSGGGFDSLVICTAWGVKVLQLTTGEEAPVKQTAPEDCPVCSVHVLKLSLAGAGSPGPVPANVDGDVIKPAADYRVPELVAVAPMPIRAPPMPA